MIKLRSLIKLNEQGPSGAPAGAPVPLQTPPQTGIQPTEDPASIAPTPDTDNTPSPEDPGEYDWTKDFRAFEDAKNKAEAVAKKKLLDKMNKQLGGKKITVNASRGYGQPKTDYTVDKVKKISVEFWYKEWVAIITDENDKKYFLTPGVNIKIETGVDSESPQSDSAPQEPEPAQTGTEGGEEQPNDSVGTPTEVPPPVGGEIPPVQPDNQQPVSNVAEPQLPTQQSSVPEEPKKKKRFAELAKEVVVQDLSSFLLEFLVNDNVDLIDYVKSVKSIVNESKSARVYRSRIEIPETHFVKYFDPRDLKLAAKESLWESGNIGGHFSRGSVDISKVGRMYIIELTKEAAWKF